MITINGARLLNVDMEKLQDEIDSDSSLAKEAIMEIVDTVHTAVQTKRTPKLSNVLLAGCIQTRAEELPEDKKDVASKLFDIAEDIKSVANPRPKNN